MDGEANTGCGDLATAICTVMAKVNFVKKTGNNSFHKYRYASDEDLLASLQPAMAAAGLALIPETVQTETTKLEAAKTKYRTDVLVTYRLIHSSGQSRTIQAPGCGVDSEDKGVYKAMTGALKYAMRHTFLVPTGDDPERYEAAPEPPRAAPTAAKKAPKKPAPKSAKTGIAFFEEQCKQNKLEFNAACAAVASAATSGKEPDEMSDEQLKGALKWLLSEAGQDVYRGYLDHDKAAD